MQDAAVAQELLTALGKLPISLEILTKTRIGFTVNALRKSIKHDEATSAVAKELIKRWKKLIDNRDTGGQSNGTPAVAAAATAKSPQTASSSAKASPSASQVTKKPHAAQRTTSIPADSSDGVRSKCREMLCTALSTPLPDSFANNDDMDFGELGDSELVAEKIEESIFREFKNVDNRYKNRVRSRVANLKDNRNPDLRLNVLKGIIKPDRIATMDAVVSHFPASRDSDPDPDPSQEMASEDMKKLRDKITQEMIQEHQMSITGGTSTDLIKCSKCRKTNVTYNQVQTRSADEPMTTFCLCNECGKRWKFC